MAFVPVVLWDKTTYRDKKGLIRLNDLWILRRFIVKHIIEAHDEESMLIVPVGSEFSFMKANAKRYKISIN
jgi:hypothetical protein